ncbi:MAG: hypothetical protein A3A98_00730 [Candidatus Staskawiczbacteria bacterium RIFCSPLOWO2_01_FULL_40_39]|uniref:Excinuclease ABC subunit C n=1 Tax=Candidatus Staskawiczbacteria bacterium RIFCSPHIGHO2_01_FULL_39_25 TaxID=1802202 RepID=A0A1G2HNE4_9BACT|nr:MAG: hypothetical protein A2730_00730 [Candidatus Staskawiczbacteria bacterium RIFCSPHIGHO2_01_FULL_39_25]OGZ73258.1 MAG: hypothetical protein A3A98_00730 [Candidatus Staskawiczbacteria bacterium RIFCSPLOWO2_01_FULL_40_39]OGZ74745.1 MAG: hypothetical protein A3I87_00610 [Candidatus Staskawiczbacteria bacterium RIFCSPLOWO2_02_FULL_39_8]
MEKFTVILKSKMQELPNMAGVYLFYEGRNIIYIGKAINIKERVKNHFLQPTYKDNFFIEKVEKIGFINTESEIEALILEANLIKKHQPKFNQVWRDNKNYFYVVITKGPKPIVFIAHQRKNENAHYIGPYVEGTSLKKTLKYLRKVFPYYTSQKHPHNKCTWCHLGLCPGPMPDIDEYKKNLRKLVLILQGKRKTAFYALKKEMAVAAKAKDFEKAAAVRDRIHALEHIMGHAKVIEQRHVSPDQWQATQAIFESIINSRQSIQKIECYDISNIQGTLAVGSMVVFVNGSPDRSQYKKFRIRMENKPNDIAMLKEVLTRRLTHPEWSYPEVMLIDGGIAQLNIGIKAKNESLANTTAVDIARPVKNIKIISIAKGRQELFIEGKKNPIPLKNLPQEIYNLIKRLDDEAHRFAITYHKKLRKKYLLN